jgi:alpha-glucosidase
VTRSGFPGIQRYAQSWSGDNTTAWESLKWNLRTGLTMSLSGLGNIGHDIGGFAGPSPGPELLIRWTQAGLLHPRFLMNSWKADNVTTSPWLHPEALPAIRAALRLRLRLMPYLYSAMLALHRSNAPFLAPTFLHFEDDVRTFADCDAFMVGPALLAAPVTIEGAREISLYLPKGPECWRDFWSGAVYPSGEVVTLPAPLERLPLLVPAGAIIPIADGDEAFARRHDEPSRAALIFPGSMNGRANASLYEDDGISTDGALTEVSMALAWTPSEVEVAVGVQGGYALPYDQMRIVPPPGENRALKLSVEKGGETASSLRLVV